MSIEHHPASVPGDLVAQRDRRPGHPAVDLMVARVLTRANGMEITAPEFNEFFELVGQQSGAPTTDVRILGLRDSPDDVGIRVLLLSLHQPHPSPDSLQNILEQHPHSLLSPLTGRLERSNYAEVSVAADSETARRWLRRPTAAERDLVQAHLDRYSPCEPPVSEPDNWVLHGDRGFWREGVRTSQRLHFSASDTAPASPTLSR